MPASAVPWEMRATLGKVGALKLWDQVWSDGVALGGWIGLGVGIAGTLLLVLMLAVAVLIIVKLRGRS